MTIFFTRKKTILGLQPLTTYLCKAVMPFAFGTKNMSVVQVRGHYPAFHGATYALVN